MTSPARALWVRFSREVALPARLGPAARSELLRILDPDRGDSEWSRAARLLGMDPGRGAEHGPLVRWVGETPYVNWSRVVSMVSHGCVELGERESLSRRAPLRRLPALLAGQWRVERFVVAAEEPGSPAERVSGEAGAITESLALGLALLALTLRLPRHSPAELAAWLADPGRAPARARAPVRLLQALQLRRGSLSSAWERRLAPGSGQERGPGANAGDLLSEGWGDGEAGPAPEAFWGGMRDDAGPEAAPSSPASGAEGDEFQGAPVHPGRLVGHLLVVDRLGDAAIAEIERLPRPRILAFRQAHPRATELFHLADAVVFAAGGALAHACVVARERRLPAVTAVGSGFVERARRAGPGARVEIDGGAGRAAFLA